MVTDEITHQLGGIQKAVAEEGEDSVAAHIQKLRDENREGFRALDGLTETIRESLVKNLQDLVEEMRDIIANQLTDSLNRLIVNIEEALIKQFGATFAEFNSATQAIKKWQEDHREQVEQLTSAFDTVARRITDISDACATIPPTMRELNDIVTRVHGDIVQFNKQAEAFAGLAKKAEAAFPTIKKHLDKIGDDLAQAATGFDGMEDTLRSTFTAAHEQSLRLSREHTEQLAALSGSMEASLRRAESEIVTSVATTVDRISVEADRIVRRLVAEVERTRVTCSGLTEAQQNAIDTTTKALEGFTNDMKRSARRITTEWGGSVLSIAKQCAEVIDRDDAQTRRRR